MVRRRRDDKYHREKQREVVEHEGVIESAFLPAADQQQDLCRGQSQTDQAVERQDPARLAVLDE